MTLRKTTFDNSVRYIPKHEQTEEIKQNTIKKKETFRKQKNIFHKTIKNTLIMWQHKHLVSLNE